jgi:predicted signal transduction protein with EAL and GGDEF domain
MGTVPRRRLGQTSAHRRQKLAAEQLSEPWHQALLASMHDVVLVAGNNAVLSVSIGIVTVQADAAKHADPMMLLRNADAAIYKAKQGGKAIVSALAQLGTTLGLPTIAEGIETPEEADLLRSYGCGLGQGYLLARPMPAHAQSSLLARSEAS